MIEFAPTQPDEMRRRHEAKGRARPVAKAATTKIEATARNVEPILSIGNTEYFHFRGRAFGVPPLPWKAGQRISDCQARAYNALAVLSSAPTDQKTRAEYYEALGQLPALLWANCRPTGKIWRAIKATPLLRYVLRNPFDGATDRELLELTDFFSSRRMKSGAQPSPMLARPRRSTSSTS